MKRATLPALIAINGFVCALAWAVVIGRIAAPRGAFEAVPMVLSTPGWLLAILIWGYNSPESALSDAVILITNTAVYTVIEVLLVRLAKVLGQWASRRRPSSD
jgi:hypothetical protein